MIDLVPQVCDLIHREAEKLLGDGVTAVDATAGNGMDTLFLCQKVGQTGKVYAFDIQQEAIDATGALLEKYGYADRSILICDGHEKMTSYIKEPVHCVLFNLGYLPKGNHLITTRKETTVQALEAALSLLLPGGAVFIALYWGHPGGEEERIAVEVFAQNLPAACYKVSETSFPNRNKAPLMMMIQKKQKGNATPWEPKHPDRK